MISLSNKYKGLSIILILLVLTFIGYNALKKDDLKDSVINICYILNSIQFNKNIIESMVGDNKLNYSSEQFSLFDEEKDTSSFLQYVQEYDKYYDVDGELPTDDQITSIELTAHPFLGFEDKNAFLDLTFFED